MHTAATSTSRRRSAATLYWCRIRFYSTASLFCQAELATGCPTIVSAWYTDLASLAGRHARQAWQAQEADCHFLLVNSCLSFMYTTLRSSLSSLFTTTPRTLLMEMSGLWGTVVRHHSWPSVTSSQLADYYQVSTELSCVLLVINPDLQSDNGCHFQGHGSWFRCEMPAGHWPRPTSLHVHACTNVHPRR